VTKIVVENPHLASRHEESFTAYEDVSRMLHTMAVGQEDKGFQQFD
jgi:hypothetical protein